MLKIKINNKGISLIVLIITIIVIIILAGSVILSLAENNPINTASEASKKSNLKTYDSQLSLIISNKYLDDQNFNPKEQLFATTWDGSENIEGTIKEYIPSITPEEGLKYSIQGGKLCYTGTDATELSYATDLNVKYKYENKPELVTGMTPVIFNTTTNTWDVVTNPNTNTNWYDYDSSRWANARTNDGSMWVWIPRYIYKITSGWHSNTTGNIEIQFTQGTNDNWNSNVIGEINIDTTANASNNTWTNHSAFTFGTTELTGIWVAKFEATAREGVADTTAGDNVTTKNVKITPGVPSWRNIYISKAFDVCRKMELDNTFGWGTTGIGIDTHLTKNVEWGAISYLSHSKYGINSGKIISNSFYLFHNNTITYYAGGETATSYINNVSQSTTGNIYGIYDINGGAGEHTAAYVNNGHNNLTRNGLSLVNALAKYKDVYEVGIPDDNANNYAKTVSKKGDALWETSSENGETYSSSSWNNQNIYIPLGQLPFFSATNSFQFSRNDGLLLSGIYGSDPLIIFSSTGFRPCLVISPSI